MLVRISTFLFSVTLLMAVCTIAAVGQDLDDVTVSGRVTDSNGLAVVGATVAVTLTETGVARTIVTDDDGRYRFLKLKPGTY